MLHRPFASECMFIIADFELSLLTLMVANGNVSCVAASVIVPLNVMRSVDAAGNIVSANNIRYKNRNMLQ